MYINICRKYDLDTSKGLIRKFSTIEAVFIKIPTIKHISGIHNSTENDLIILPIYYYKNRIRNNENN